MTDTDQNALEWTCHPVKRRPMVSVAVTVFVFVVVLATYYTTQSRVFALLALVVLLASLAKFYFPTSYRLTADKIFVKTTTMTQVKAWSQFRSCYPDRNGVLLSPFTEPSRLENFRGIYLMVEAANRDEVIAFVKAHLAGKMVAAAGAGNEEEKEA